MDYEVLDLLEHIVMAIEEMSTRNCVAESTAQDLEDKLDIIRKEYYGF